MNYDFQYHAKTEVPTCPSCHGVVPTAADSALAFRLNVRKGGVTFNCLMRSCWCGLEMAIDQTREDRWGYSFQCARCGSYEASLPFEGRCTACYLHQVVGLKDPGALYAGVREAEPFIPLTRQDTIDGLLKGLLNGMPGLTCDDGPEQQAA